MKVLEKTYNKKIFQKDHSYGYEELCGNYIEDYMHGWPYTNHLSYRRTLYRDTQKFMVKTNCMKILHY